MHQDGGEQTQKEGSISQAEDGEKNRCMLKKQLWHWAFWQSFRGSLFFLNMFCSLCVKEDELLILNKPLSTRGLFHRFVLFNLSISVCMSV